MAAITNISEQPFFYGPSPNDDTVPIVTSNLELAEVMACLAVSNAWNKTMNRVIWPVLFDTENVPSEPGKRTKEDFQYMYPRTATTTKKVAPLGRFIFGIMPNIDPAKHATFKTALDAYDPTQKMDKTWEYVCKPTHIHRKYEEGDEKLVELLKTQGDFETTADPSELKKTGLLIPFTFRNLVIIAN